MPGFTQARRRRLHVFVSFSLPRRERFVEPVLRALAHPGHVAVGPDQHGDGSGDGSDDGKLPGARAVGVDMPDPVRPRGDVDAAGLTEVEQHRPGVVEQLEDPARAFGRGEVEVWHPASEQRVPLPRSYLTSSPDRSPASWARGSSNASSSATRVAQRLGPRVRSLEEGLDHHVVQRSGRGRVPLRVVGVQQLVGRDAVDHLGELPAEVDRVLHAEADALPAGRADGCARRRRRAAPARCGRRPPAGSRR